MIRQVNKGVQHKTVSVRQIQSAKVFGALSQELRNSIDQEIIENEFLEEADINEEDVHENDLSVEDLSDYRDEFDFDYFANHEQTYSADSMNNSGQMLADYNISTNSDHREELLQELC